MEEIVKVDSVTLRPVDNGFILNACFRTKNKNSDSPYAESSYDEIQEVYTDEQVDEAVMRLKEFASKMKKV